MAGANTWLDEGRAALAIEIAQLVDVRTASTLGAGAMQRPVLETGHVLGHSASVVVITSVKPNASYPDESESRSARSDTWSVFGREGDMEARRPG